MKKFFGDSHRDQIILFDPALASQNIGDEIISSSACKWLQPLFRDEFVLHVSSHQKMSFRYKRYLNDSKLTFVLGSNLLKAGMLFGFRQWDVSLLDTFQINDAVLVGCGWHTYERRIDPYSKFLYRRLLSSHYYHSVRDEYAKKKLEEMGITNVLNTGCATMWGFTPEYCATIPRKKASTAVVTLTDYNQDPERDEQMLSILLRSYEKVSIWLQGNGDRGYASMLPSFTKCDVIPPTLDAFDAALERDDTDYVGTRLHGGIRALQHGRRSLIVAIDNRAREMHKDFNIPVLEREEIGGLDGWICGEGVTDIHIPANEIERFLSQFR